MQTQCDLQRRVKHVCLIRDNGRLVLLSLLCCTTFMEDLRTHIQIRFVKLLLKEECEMDPLETQIFSERISADNNPWNLFLSVSRQTEATVSLIKSLFPLQHLISCF